MAEADYYETLGVPRDAAADAIKKAYRLLARKYHPDVNPGDKTAEAKFLEAQRAYDVLSDAEKRSLYDRYGKAAFEGMAAAGHHHAPPQDWGAGGGPGATFEEFDINDFFGSASGRTASASVDPSAGGGIFEELLGRMRTGGARTGPKGGAGMRPRAGRHVDAALSIPFLTAARGGETAVEVDRNGRRESLVVKIPAGIETGARLRLRGQGEPGEKGASAGDLTIVVTVEPHPYYQRDGRNLLVDLPITVAEAVLGARVDVPTPNGLKSLTVPPGASSGQRLRLRGLGIPASGDRPEGDLYVVVKVVVPKTVDDDSRRLIREFADRNPQQPRDGLWTSP